MTAVAVVVRERRRVVRAAGRGGNVVRRVASTLLSITDRVDVSHLRGRLRGAVQRWVVVGLLICALGVDPRFLERRRAGRDAGLTGLDGEVRGRAVINFLGTIVAERCREGDVHIAR